MTLTRRTAHGAGARLHLACEIAGIDERTLLRWKAMRTISRLMAGPRRRDRHPAMLCPDLRAKLFSLANEPRFTSVPPARIVPILADDRRLGGDDSDDSD